MPRSRCERVLAPHPRRGRSAAPLPGAPARGRPAEDFTRPSEQGPHTFARVCRHPKLFLANSEGCGKGVGERGRVGALAGRRVRRPVCEGPRDVSGPDKPRWGL